MSSLDFQTHAVYIWVAFHAGEETQDKMTKIDGTNLLFNLKYNFKWCKNYDAKMNFKILYHHISV